MLLYVIKWNVIVLMGGSAVLCHEILCCSGRVCSLAVWCGAVRCDGVDVVNCCGETVASEGSGEWPMSYTASYSHLLYCTVLYVCLAEELRK